MPGFNFDQEQQQAITSLANTIVVAGAGAGKTSVLAGRFLWLITTQRATVNQILCLTFTNKAAAEMQERIYKMLKADPSPAARQALADFHKSQISTIDSFCTTVARETSYLFGLAHDFIIDDSKSYKLLKQLSLDFYLWNCSTAAFKELSQRLSFDEIVEELLLKLALDYFTIADSHDFIQIINQQAAIIKEHYLCLRSNLIETCNKLFSLNFKTIDTNRNLLTNLLSSLSIAANSITPSLTNLLQDIKLSKQGLKDDKDEHVKAKELIDQFQEYKNKMLAILAAITDEDLLLQLAELFNHFQQEVKLRKCQTKTVTFRDLLAMAVQALKQNMELRNHYKNKYRYIMIDEFQDNNHLQKELLFLLAERDDLSTANIPDASQLEPHKLFFVGDEKQSIYAFRGAEVAVFKKLKGELQKAGGQVINLNKNYRSHPQLITFFNSLFSKIMANSQKDFEAEFTELKATIPEDGQPPLLRFYACLADAQELEEAGFDKIELEAWSVANFIKETVEQRRLMVEVGGQKRPANWDDFALLLRSSSNQSTFEKYFRYLGIPYTTQNMRSLFLEAPISDIYALFACALDPTNRLAYAALLRSPFVRLSDEGLLKVLLACQKPFSPIDLSGDDASRYDQGKEIYNYLVAQIDRRPLTELINHVWHNFGYRYHILANPQAWRYLEYFDFFFKLAAHSQQRGETTSQFFSWVEQNLGQYERLSELENLSTQPASVQIMSVHKSKGLEFPIVIIADLANEGRKREKNPILFFSQSYGPVINLGDANYLIQLSILEEQARAEAELKRLFYVACTRAKSHLVFSGTLKDGLSPNKSFLHLLCLGLDLTTIEKDALHNGLELIIKSGLPQLEPMKLDQEHIKSFKTMVETYKKLQLLKRTWPICHISVSVLNEFYKQNYASNFKTGVLAPLDVDQYLDSPEVHARWGELVHKILAAKLTGCYQQTALQIELLCNFNRKALPNILKTSEELADAFLTLNEVQDHKRASRLEVEYPFILKQEVDGRLVYINGVIDLFYIVNCKIRLFDFKTDSFLCPEAYYLQLTIYRQFLQEYFKQDVKTFLYYCRNNRLFPVVNEINIKDILKDFFDHNQLR